MTRIKQINEEAEAYSRRFHKIKTEYTEEALYTEEAFRSGALWMYNQLIDNACEWLEDHVHEYIIQVDSDAWIDEIQLGIDFRKAMKN